MGKKKRTTDLKLITEDSLHIDFGLYSEGFMSISDLAIQYDITSDELIELWKDYKCIRIQTYKELMKKLTHYQNMNKSKKLKQENKDGN